MIIVRFHLRTPLRYPRSEISVAARLARPGCSVELFETTASAGPGRKAVGIPAISRLPRHGYRMSRLRRHGLAGRTGICPRSNGAVWEGSRHSPVFSVTFLRDKTSRQDLPDFVRSGMTDPLEAA
jgi:hypothetical protein